MENGWNIGDQGYINVSNVKIEPVKITGISGDFLTLRFVNADGGTRLRKSRVFHTIEDAEASLPEHLRQKNRGNGARSPWQF